MTHVAIAGAGPVGLTAALLLAMQGVRVTVLEKRAALGTASRASTIHPPTLEILDRMGVLAPVAHEGQVADRIQYRTPDGIFAELPLSLLAGETAFPYRLHLEQTRFTPVMLDRLRTYPHAAIRFDTEATAVDQDPAGVTLHTPAGPLRADWAIAADGAHSALRDHLGIGFPGAVYPHKVLRVMTRDDLDALLPGIAPVTYLHNGPRSISFLKMPDYWRMILRVPEDVPDDQAMDESWILARFHDVLPAAPRLPTPLSKDVYRASRRVADQVQHGRVLVIGDAAHVTNTRGGMNMNCGIHDAAALADTIAAGGDVAATMAERARIAAELLIPRTDRTVSGTAAAFAETMRATAADPASARAYLRTSAMLDMLTRGPIHA